MTQPTAFAPDAFAETAPLQAPSTTHHSASSTFFDAAVLDARADAASIVASAHAEAIAILSDAVADLRDDRAAGGGMPITVVLDAESFAKAFASAMAGVLEKRPETPARQIIELGPEYVPLPQLGPVPVVRANGQPSLWPAYGAPQRRSFWANAWHPDVLLSVVAMIIVLIVLVAFAT